MSCPYEFYNDEEVYYPKLYCNITNKICPYSKKCEKEHKFISLENQKECYNYIMEEKKKIPNGSYYVETFRPNKNNKLILYVLVDNKIERITTEYTELNQNYVYIKKNGDKCEVSLTPFVEKVEKRTYTQNTNTNSSRKSNNSKSKVKDEE